MWICLNDAFLSIIEDYADKEKLVVRARRRQDLINFAGDEIEIEETPRRDYRFRTVLYRSTVANLLAKSIFNINYNNFKNSVKDKDLAYMYNEVWVSGVRHLDPTMPERQWGVEPI